LRKEDNMAKKKSQPALEQLISLKGKTALITGAASGIGRAVAARYAEAGAALQLIDLSEKGLKDVHSALTKNGAEAEYHVLDLSSKKEIEALWKKIHHNTPDILINNAGFYPFREFVDVEEEYFRKVMDTNLHSVYWMCQQMIRARLKSKKGGVIINMGSIEAVLPFKDDLGHYSISKAGVIALTRALAREHARHGFRVNAILPGGIVTEGTKSVAKEVLSFRFGLLKTGIEFAMRLPAGRAGQPDEVARVALFLGSELASYMHGAVVPVDGGFLSA
jgi:NAD(P)-dependent dehydrogenase (short-subunit alcohol dehydrogenase family)